MPADSILFRGFFWFFALSNTRYYPLGLAPFRTSRLSHRSRNRPYSVRFLALNRTVIFRLKELGFLMVEVHRGLFSHLLLRVLLDEAGPLELWAAMAALDAAPLSRVG
jgi:hypothetical protein